jgi:hypothetical protein
MTIVAAIPAFNEEIAIGSVIPHAVPGGCEHGF